MSRLRQSNRIGGPIDRARDRARQQERERIAQIHAALEVFVVWPSSGRIEVVTGEQYRLRGEPPKGCATFLTRGEAEVEAAARIAAKASKGGSK